MATTPDDVLEFEFDLERSRAAVTIACLEWLRCTGPAIEPSLPSTRVTSPDAAETYPDFPPNPSPNPFDPTHPLWDRWIDG